MKKASPNGLRFAALAALVLAMTCWTFAQSQESTSSDKKITLDVARDFTSSGVELSLDGVAATYDSKGQSTPPEWAVYATAGKKVASGKFQYG